MTTRVEVLQPDGPTRGWLPATINSPTPYQRTLANVFTAPGGTAKLVENRTDALGIVVAEFAAGVKPVLTLTSRIATGAHVVDRSASGSSATTDAASLAHFRRPTRLLPTDGIVRIVANDITRGAKTDVGKRGCGIGDSCWSRGASEASARISTRFTSASHAPRDFLRATCMAFG